VGDESILGEASKLQITEERNKKSEIVTCNFIIVYTALAFLGQIDRNRRENFEQ
jgi:hypothetical protein